MKFKLSTILRALVIPTFNEVSLFSMSLTCIFLIITSFKFHILFTSTPPANGHYEVLIIYAVFAGGLLLSIFPAFSTREKSSFEKIFMLFFACFISGFGETWSGTYLVSVRKRFFSAVAASICGLACATYRCTPPRKPLISLSRRKIPRFQIGNHAVSIRSFPMDTTYGIEPKVGIGYFPFGTLSAAIFLSLLSYQAFTVGGTLNRAPETRIVPFSFHIPFEQ